MERKQFTFYESFFEAVSRIRDLAQRAEGGMRGSPVKESPKIRQRPRKDPAKEGEKENEKEKEVENELELEIEGEGEREGVPAPLGGESAPPSYEEVLEEANRQGCPDLARSFYDYYQAGNWRDVTGRPVQSWPQKLTAWRFREDGMVRKVLGPTGWAQLAREMDGVQ